MKSSRRERSHDISSGVALMIGLFVSVQPRSPQLPGAAFTDASESTGVQKNRRRSVTGDGIETRVMVKKDIGKGDMSG